MLQLLISGILGNFLEVYDLCLYGYFIAIIGAQFFPPLAHLSAITYGYAIFCIGYLSRPLGAIMIGWIGDQYGRKQALSLSILLISFSTAAIGLLPSYNSIGLWAPFLLLLLRLLQGISMGGEYTGSIVYFLESTSQNKRGYLVSLAIAASDFGMLIAAFTSLILSHLTSNSMISHQGWRLAFLIALLGGFVGWFVRRKLPESILFQQAITTPLSPFKQLKKQKKSLFMIILLAWPGVVTTYLLYVYSPTLFSTQLHWSMTKSLSMVSLSLLEVVVLIPLAGLLCDRLGRKPLLLYGTLGLGLLLPNYFYCLGQSKADMVIFLQQLLTLPSALYFTGATTLIAELLPVRIRFLGTAFAYNLSCSIFGGTAPLLTSWLLIKFHTPLLLSLYPLSCIFVLLFFYSWIPETRPTDWSISPSPLASEI